MQALFTATIFLGALLLFCVQPMIAKAILPLLGGAPQVWITCMLFFQAALLAGYAYAHAAVEKLGVKRQLLAHVAVCSLPLLVVGHGSTLGVPFTLPLDRWPGAAGHDPSWQLLGLLASTVGLSFLVVSTTSPLLSRWFSTTAHPNARDPYFLYRGSNIGSLLALLGYPILIEPNLGLARQSRLWAWGYSLLVALVAACAIVAWPTRKRSDDVAAVAMGKSAEEPGDAAEAAPSWGRRLGWIALAFVPSTHLLGVTTYLTTDIAPIPLLWVIPLALYLGTFILVFAKKPLLPHAAMVRLLPIGAAASILTLLAEAGGPLWLLAPLHLATFFVAAMVCHGELAQGRPDRRYLTSFYLCMSVGGVLGGLFNGLVAPLVLDRLAEYPLAIVLACLLRRVPEEREGANRRRRLDLAVPALAGVLTAGLILGWRSLGRAPDQLSIGVVFGAPILLVYRYLAYPLRFGLSLGAIALAGVLYTGTHGVDLHRERTFFGTLRVTRDHDGLHRLVHGSISHGSQHRGAERRREPLGYYTREGPIGRAFERLGRASDRRARIGVIGLGAGVLASYARPGQAWTFYEINPAIERIARDGRYFTYLEDAFPGGNGLAVEVGDARIRLREAPEHHFDLFIIDAFSSDSIPMHLLTRQALALYAQKLSPGGALAFHISNSFLDLGAVIANLAHDAAMVAWLVDDAEPAAGGKAPSRWAFVARFEADLGDLPRERGAARLSQDADVGVWTDDFSNILRILH